MLTPTLPCVAPRVGAGGVGDLDVREAIVSRTFPVNVLGWPALAIPCGAAEDGLPASVQLVGRPGADALVLAAGALLEAGAVTADLELALRLADAADAISLPLFGTKLPVERKPDLTPVTEADRAVEAELRRLLAEARPEDGDPGRGGGVVREPAGGGGSSTRSTARATSRGRSRCGRRSSRSRRTASSGSAWSPRRRSAVAGGPSAAPGRSRTEGGSTCRPSSASRTPCSASVSRTGCRSSRSAWHVRGFGDFWSHMLVAEGAVDGAFDVVGVSEWDLAATQVVVEEAGGRFSDYAGDSRIDGGTALSSNGLLHDALLRIVTP